MDTDLISFVVSLSVGFLRDVIRKHDITAAAGSVMSHVVFLGQQAGTYDIRHALVRLSRHIADAQSLGGYF